MPTFKATQVGALEEDGLLIVGFNGGLVDGMPTYLVFQHSLDGPGEEDARRGMNQPYIEYRDQAWGWYGHMTRVELRRDRLLVSLDASAVERLGDDSLFDVRFEIDDDAFDQLRNGLEKTFGDCSYFSVRLQPAT